MFKTRVYEKPPNAQVAFGGELIFDASKIYTPTFSPIFELQQY